MLAGDSAPLTYENTRGKSWHAAAKAIVPAQKLYDPAEKGIVYAARTLSMERLPARASAPVRVATSRQSANSQPAERNVPTANRATVATAQAIRSSRGRACPR